MGMRESYKALAQAPAKLMRLRELDSRRFGPAIDLGFRIVTPWSNLLRLTSPSTGLSSSAAADCSSWPAPPD
jgi:hypothetical protein